MAAKKRVSRAAKSAGRKKKTKAPKIPKRVTKVRSLAGEGNLKAARLQADLRESIEKDIAERIEAHQSEVARIRANVRADRQPPLMLLAHGDSWFDYPCDGNTPTPFSTSDIIAHLKKMGNPKPKILNLSHFGDATTDEMGLQKQKRLIDALSNRNNWLNGKPDAILFSGGGNDIAGDPYCIYLNHKNSGLPGLDAARFAGRLDSIRSSYLDLFAFRDRYAPQVPIFGHAYDFARPMPRPHPPCMGPWMSPALSFAGWSLAEGTQIIHDALDAFGAMLGSLEGSQQPNYDFTVVPTQGTLTKDDWANELHPHPPGFEKLAEKFLDILRHRFSGRI
jgi:hypothetical protein